ncbi:MAG: EamA family transporter [Nanoarchaeota archaeon]
MNIILALIFIFISSVFGAFSTLMFKLGAAFKVNFRNKKLIWAVTLAGVSFLFYIYALKQAPLTFIYLIASISYLWAIILAKVFLKEKISKFKIIGICLIFLGIFVIYI